MYDLTKSFNLDSSNLIERYSLVGGVTYTGYWSGVLPTSLPTIDPSILTNIATLKKKSYIIPDEFHMRPDLLAKEYYGDFNYTSLILIQSSVSSWQLFTSRTVIQLASKADLEAALIKR